MKATRTLNIQFGNDQLTATEQPSGRINLYYAGSDSLIRDFVQRTNSEETCLYDVIVALEDEYGEGGVIFGEVA